MRTLGILLVPVVLLAATAAAPVATGQEQAPATPDDSGYWLLADPCAALPRILLALGTDPTSPHLAVTRLRARAYPLWFTLVAELPDNPSWTASRADVAARLQAHVDAGMHGQPVLLSAEQRSAAWARMGEAAARVWSSPRPLDEPQGWRWLAVLLADADSRSTWGAVAEWSGVGSSPVTCASSTAPAPAPPVGPIPRCTSLDRLAGRC